MSTGVVGKQGGIEMCAPSAGLRLPWFCVFISLTAMTWTIILWCWLSVPNICLAFTQVVLSVVLSILLHWLYIHYSNFIRRTRIFDILKTTTDRTLRLRLKIDFDTDLTPNITRHSCIISAELVVSSFINNLVRLSSMVPFHIHLSNKLILKE